MNSEKPVYTVKKQNIFIISFEAYNNDVGRALK